MGGRRPMGAQSEDGGGFIRLLVLGCRVGGRIAVLVGYPGAALCDCDCVEVKHEMLGVCVSVCACVSVHLSRGGRCGEHTKLFNLQL